MSGCSVYMISVDKHFVFMWIGFNSITVKGKFISFIGISLPIPLFHLKRRNLAGLFWVNIRLWMDWCSNILVCDIWRVITSQETWYSFQIFRPIHSVFVSWVMMLRSYHMTRVTKVMWHKLERDWWELLIISAQGTLHLKDIYCLFAYIYFSPKPVLLMVWYPS